MNQIARKIRSLLISVWVDILRVIDHSYRTISGRPTLKRSTITPHLYIGGQYKLSALPFFRKLGITAIVNMRMKSIYSEKDIKPIALLNLPTVDWKAPTLKQLQEGVVFIEQQIKEGGKVYIHCFFGEGRGPTMGAAYLVSQGMTVDDALATIRKNRPFIRVTPSQIERLSELYKKVKAVPLKKQTTIV